MTARVSKSSPSCRLIRRATPLLSKWLAVSVLNQPFQLRAGASDRSLNSSHPQNRSELRNVMKRICIIGSTTWVALATCPFAAAADLPVSYPVKAQPVVGLYDWTGFYVGGHIGLVTGNSGWTLNPLGGGAPAAGSFGLYQSPNAFKVSGSWFEGVQGGYNWMLKNRVVLGIEGDSSFPTFPDAVSGLTIGGISNFTSPTFGAGTFSENVLASGTLRGRIGYAPGHWLFYATGGFAYSYDQFTRTQIAGIPAGGTAMPGTVENLFMVPRIGGVVGAGAEVALDAHWAARFEYLYTDYATRGVTFPAGAQRFDSGLTLQTLRLGLDYKLGTNGVDPDLFTKGFSALEL